MQDQPRQICVRGEEWVNGEWVAPFLAWENGQALDKDELRDVAEAYNLLLIQQFAAQVDFVE
jgi:hypothetical protein